MCVGVFSVCEGISGNTAAVPEQLSRKGKISHLQVVITHLRSQSSGPKDEIAHPVGRIGPHTRPQRLTFNAQNPSRRCRTSSFNLAERNRSQLRRDAPAGGLPTGRGVTFQCVTTDGYTLGPHCAHVQFTPAGPDETIVPLRRPGLVSWTCWRCQIFHVSTLHTL